MYVTTDANAIIAPTTAETIAVWTAALGRSPSVSLRVTKKPTASAYTTAIAEPSVAVNAPPTIPPITTTGIRKMMIERLSSWKIRLNENESPVNGYWRLMAMKEHAAIISVTRMSPGTTPAMNMPPTDTVGPAMKA